MQSIDRSLTPVQSCADDDRLAPVLIAFVSLTLLWSGLQLLLRTRTGIRLQRWHYRQKDEWHQHRLLGRLRAGEDRYFEELRAIEANAPRAPNLNWPTFQGWNKVLAFSTLLGLIQALDVSLPW